MKQKISINYYGADVKDMGRTGTGLYLSVDNLDIMKRIRSWADVRNFADAARARIEEKGGDVLASVNLEIVAAAPLGEIFFPRIETNAPAENIEKAAADLLLDLYRRGDLEVEYDEIGATAAAGRFYQWIARNDNAGITSEMFSRMAEGAHAIDDGALCGIIAEARKE